MKRKSLQQIEDFYVNKGYVGENLRNILEKDKEYKNLLKERKQKLTKKFKITNAERKRYVLSLDKDFEILNKCKKLERLNITKEDKILVKLIKSQIEDNWRKTLLNKLNNLINKYKR